VNPAIALLHPAFIAAALGVTLSREGDFSSAGGGEDYATSEDGVTLKLRTSKPQGRWIVSEARHGGGRTRIQRGVLDVFCQVIEGLPLQEAADHGAIHALERLRGDPLARPIPGILTPHSAGSAFIGCERLIRSIVAEHAKRNGDADKANFWNPALSAEWRNKSVEQRIAQLEPVMKRFRAAHELADEDLWIDSIEKTRRVIIGFGPKIGYNDKPSLLMRLEIDIRQATGDRLELFMAEAKDNNTIRRLTPEEETQ